MPVLAKDSFESITRKLHKGMANLGQMANFGKSVDRRGSAWPGSGGWECLGKTELKFEKLELIHAHPRPATTIHDDWTVLPGS